MVCLLAVCLFSYDTKLHKLEKILCIDCEVSGMHVYSYTLWCKCVFIWFQLSLSSIHLYVPLIMILKLNSTVRCKGMLDQIRTCGSWAQTLMTVDSQLSIKMGNQMELSLGVITSCSRVWVSVLKISKPTGMDSGWYVCALFGTDLPSQSVYLIVTESPSKL